MVLKAKIQNVINQGGHVPSDDSEEEVSRVTLRMPSYMLNKLDELVKARPGMTRTGLILECIMEKIKREEHEKD